MNAVDGQADSSDLKDEPGDFIETNCHWRDCGTEFPTQDDLVKVGDGEKKVFVVEICSLL